MSIRSIMLFVLIIFTCSFVIPTNTFADNESSWVQNNVKGMVYRDQALSRYEQTTCLTDEQSIHIAELVTNQKACISYGHNIQIGFFGTETQSRMIFKYPYQTEFHLVNGICSNASCLYSVQTDTLVVQQPLAGPGFKLLFYQHASSRIKNNNGSTAGGYAFDATAVNYELKNSTNDFLPTMAMAQSSNGRWLTVELRGKGIALIDLLTNEFRHVTFTSYGYGYGYDPAEELAVSNDGKTIVVSGNNAGFTVIANVDDCGQPLTDNLVKNDLTRLCQQTDLRITEIFPLFKSGHKPRFSDDDQQLTLRLLMNGQASREVTFAANPASLAVTTDLISLGDSFSSGEGEDDDRHYLNVTNTPVDNCHVSDRSYPFLLTSGLPKIVHSVACAGASINDIIGKPDQYNGQDERLGPNGLNIASNQKKAVTYQALDSFIPGRIKQSAFIERYKPKVATIGVGGNDAGLMAKLSVCAMPGTCEWAEGEGPSRTIREIARLFDTLVGMYNDLIAKSASTRLYAIGYPQLISDKSKCDQVTGLLFDDKERTFMRQSVAYLDEVIQAAAKKVGITYIDVQQSFTGNELCSGSSKPAMNGLVPGNDIALVSTLPGIKLIGAGSFHPTPFGHELIAGTINTKYGDLRSYNRCVETSIPCPQPSQVPSYPDFLQDLPSASAETFFGQFLSWFDRAKGQLVISVASGSFLPGSTIKAEIRSTPVPLGQFIVAPNGSLQATLELPADVEEAIHTIHLIGVNTDQEPIDIYQTISIGGLVHTNDAFISRSFPTVPTKTRMDMENSTFKEADSPTKFGSIKMKSVTRVNSQQTVTDSRMRLSKTMMGTLIIYGLLLCAIGTTILVIAIIRETRITGRNG